MDGWKMENLNSGFQIKNRVLDWFSRMKYSNSIYWIKCNILTFFWVGGVSPTPFLDWILYYFDLFILYCLIVFCHLNLQKMNNYSILPLESFWLLKWLSHFIAFQFSFTNYSIFPTIWPTLCLLYGEKP
jgi:hypothetical protein